MEEEALSARKEKLYLKLIMFHYIHTHTLLRFDNNIKYIETSIVNVLSLMFQCNDSMYDSYIVSVIMAFHMLNPPLVIIHSSASESKITEKSLFALLVNS